MEAWLSSLAHNGNAFKSHIDRFVPPTKTYGRDPKTNGTCPLQRRPISFVNLPGLFRCFHGFCRSDRIPNFRFQNGQLY
jgi:hypothetical protein